MRSDDEKKAREVTFLCYFLLILNSIASFFILLSRESDGSAAHRTKPDWLRSCPSSRVFQLSFASDFFNFLLVRFNQAKIIVVKHLIQL